MWYFLERTDLVTSFIKKSIPAAGHTITKPKQAEGVIFQGDYLNQVLDVLGFNPEDVEVTYVRTDDKNISMILIQDAPKKRFKRKLEDARQDFETKKDKIKAQYVKTLKDVLLGRRSGSGYDSSSEIFEIMRKIRNAHDQVERFYGEKNFADEFDRLWKMPEVKKIKLTSRYLKVTLRLGLMKKYRVRIPLNRELSNVKIFKALFSIRPEWVYPWYADGHDWGEVCFGTINFQIGDVLKSGEFTTFIKLLIIFINNGVRARFDKSPEEGIDVWRPKRIVLDPLKLIRRAMSLKSKQKYVNLMMENVSGNRTDALNELKRMQDEMGYALRSFLRHQRCQKFLKITSDEMSKLESRWLREFDNIVSNQDVDFVEVDSECIRITTKPLKIKTSKGSADLGSIRISLNLQSGQIQIENLTKRIGDYDHPCVRNGFPYFDADLWVGLIKFLARLDIPTLLTTILEYLQNPQGILISPEKWGE